MAYFAAMVARTERGWNASAADLDHVETLEDLTEDMRAAAVDEEPVLLLLEQEDAWFAVIRVDGEEDPRVFVSDAGAVSRSAYAEVLLAETEASTVSLRTRGGLLGAARSIGSEPANDLGAEATGSEDEDDEEAGPAPGETTPDGDAGLLADLGVPADALVASVSQVPADALAWIGEEAGFAEVLEQIH